MLQGTVWLGETHYIVKLLYFNSVQSRYDPQDLRWNIRHQVSYQLMDIKVLFKWTARLGSFIVWNVVPWSRLCIGDSMGIKASFNLLNICQILCCQVHQVSSRSQNWKNMKYMYSSQDVVRWSFVCSCRSKVPAFGKYFIKNVPVFINITYRTVQSLDRIRHISINVVPFCRNYYNTLLRHFIWKRFDTVTAKYLL